MTRLAVAVAAFALAAAAPAQTPAPSAPDQKSTERTAVSAATFLADAAMTGMFEIRAGLLAVRKADDPAYLDFAELMIGDHTNTREEIDKLAADLGDVRLPHAPDSAYQARIDQLGSLSGAAFERAYKAEQVRELQHAVALFRQYAKSGDKPDVKSWAAQTLPMLETSLNNAEGLAAPTAAPTTGSASPGK